MTELLGGLMGEFTEVAALTEAARQAHEAGFRRFDAYSPFPHEELEQWVPGKNRVALLALVGGITGALTAFGVQSWAWVWDEPMNVGGRPLFSWPAFIPITFELTVLFGGLSAAFGMLLMNRLPMLYHPVFEVPAFARASRDRFFLCISADDPRFTEVEVRAWFTRVGAASIHEVPREEAP